MVDKYLRSKDMSQKRLLYIAGINIFCKPYPRTIDIFCEQPGCRYADCNRDEQYACNRMIIAEAFMHFQKEIAAYRTYDKRMQ